MDLDVTIQSGSAICRTYRNTYRNANKMTLLLYRLRAVLGQ
jgi:hypothetical protein